jgi:Lecithin retinol acyltransferase
MRSADANRERFLAGDHLRVRRLFYSHHGIYVGDRHVVEFGSNKYEKSGAVIREVDLASFQRDGDLEVIDHSAAVPSPHSYSRRGRR